MSPELLRTFKMDKIYRTANEDNCNKPVCVCDYINAFLTMLVW